MTDVLTRTPARPSSTGFDASTDGPVGATHVVPRVRLWVEFLLIGLSYYVYSLIADGAPRSVEAALGRTTMFRRFEGQLHVGIEHALNQWWAADHLRMVLGNLYYDGGHFFAPVAVLVWLALWHRQSYRPLRSVLLVISLLALVAFWLYPVAPPRLLPGAGFIDTVARVHTFGGGGSHGISSAENPFAAMPSLHVAWAVWCALCVALVARRTWVRVAVWLHPLTTVFVIMATGNHLLVDAVGGLVTVALAVGVVAGVRRVRGHSGLHSD